MCDSVREARKRLYGVDELFVPRAVDQPGLVRKTTGGLPAWLGWFALVIGIVSITPLGFFGFLALLVWIVIASVVLFQQESPAPPAAAAPVGVSD